MIYFEKLLGNVNLGLLYTIISLFYWLVEYLPKILLLIYGRNEVKKINHIFKFRNELLIWNWNIAIFKFRGRKSLYSVSSNAFGFKTCSDVSGEQKHTEKIACFHFWLPSKSWTTTENCCLFFWGDFNAIYIKKVSMTF